MKNVPIFFALRLAIISTFSLLTLPPCSIARLAKVGDDLQAILDSGEDLELKAGETYEIKKPLRMRKAGQKISTQNAKTIGDYARLKLVAQDSARILDMGGIEGAEIENILFDGNRYAPRNPEKRESLVQAGGRKGNFQKVRNCAFINGRGWSFLHVFEPAEGIEITGTFMFGSGVDCRGSGASEVDKPFPWGDGVSLAAAKSKVWNNLIIDATDVGVVVFCAPGSKVFDNVVAAISRESLGAVNMVDTTAYYENSKGSKRFDYTDVEVKNNLADAKGARIHIAFPIGKHIWGPGENAGRSGRIVYGGYVLNNEIRGACAGYGIALHGVENFTVKGNKSSAAYSRAGDGMHHVRTAYPAAFLYDKKTVKNCDLQDDFETSPLNMVHLLACNFGDRRDGGEGFRMYQYGASEAMGVIDTAFKEMLKRPPNADELARYAILIDSEKLSADSLRLKLAETSEFRLKNRDFKPENLHAWRAEMWIKNLDKVQRQSLLKHKRLPNAKESYSALWQLVSNSK